MSENNPVGWLKQNMFWIAGVVSVTLFVGGLGVKVEALDRRVSDRAEREKKVDTIAESQARLDERTRLIREEQKQQRDMLNEILQNTRRR